MTLFIAILILANGLIAYYCFDNAQKKGYPKHTFMLLGMVPYFNLVVLVYLLFLPNLKTEQTVKNNHIIN